jgi:uncharacterized protein YlxW (UPF0749 family)
MKNEKERELKREIKVSQEKLKRLTRGSLEHKAELENFWRMQSELGQLELAKLEAR